MARAKALNALVTKGRRDLDGFCREPLLLTVGLNAVNSCY